MSIDIADELGIVFKTLRSAELVDHVSVFWGGFAGMCSNTKRRRSWNTGTEDGALRLSEQILEIFFLAATLCAMNDRLSPLIETTLVVIWLFCIKMR